VNPNFTGPFYNLNKTLVNGVVHYFNPGAFQIGALGQLGNAGRGTINAPNLVTVDLSIVKNTKIPKLGEAAELQIRGDFFNAPNHTNFSLPNVTIFNGASGRAAPNSQAGTISTTSTPARQLQFSARFVF